MTRADRRDTFTPEQRFFALSLVACVMTVAVLAGLCLIAVKAG